MRARDARSTSVDEQCKNGYLEPHEFVQDEAMGGGVGVIVNGYPVKWQDDV